jgi:molecular chaperone HtpG
MTIAPWSRRIPFKVDVVGVIELMGSSLYSRADTPIRELIQNAHDAIVRRRARDLSYRGRIDIEQDAAGGLLRFHDDGIGLSPHEAEEYLSTLGISLTGLFKKGLDGAVGNGMGDGLIGQFGIGLFSAFMLADRLVVESRKSGEAEGVRWEAGAGTDIELSASSRAEIGTSVTLFLKPDHRTLAEQPVPVEAAIKEYADFLTVPIFLNRGKARVNVIQTAWFEQTPERERVELELEAYFGETPLDVVPFQVEKPAIVRGALYVTPQRVPGFAGDPVVTVTVRRMVISRQIQGCCRTGRGSCAASWS